MSVARSLLEEPSAHASSANAWPPLAGRFLQIAMEATSTHCTAVNDGDYAPTVSRTVPTALAPRLATPAQLEGQPPRYSTRNAFRGAHEAVRASLRALRSPKTPFRYEAAFAVRKRTARSGGYLHKREDDDLAGADGRPPEKAKKQGGFRHQHGAMVLHVLALANPLTCPKTGRLTRQAGAARECFLLLRRFAAAPLNSRNRPP